MAALALRRTVVGVLLYAVALTALMLILDPAALAAGGPWLASVFGAIFELASAIFEAIWVGVSW